MILSKVMTGINSTNGNATSYDNTVGLYGKHLVDTYDKKLFEDIMRLVAETHPDTNYL